MTDDTACQFTIGCTVPNQPSPNLAPSTSTAQVNSINHTCEQDVGSRKATALPTRPSPDRRSPVLSSVVPDGLLTAPPAVRTDGLEMDVLSLVTLQVQLPPGVAAISEDASL